MGAGERRMEPRHEAEVLLRGLTAAHKHPPGIGCSAVAHRDLGYCALCVAQANPTLLPTFGISSELAAWRALAEVDRGTPDQTTPGDKA